MIETQKIRAWREGQARGIVGGMSARAYWRLVAKRAAQDARAALLIETGERLVVGAVVAITAIVLLWLYGSEGASWDAALERMGPWIILILAAFPVVWIWKLITVAAKMDADLREEIAVLERQLSPTMGFEWRPEDNKFLEIVESAYTRSWSDTSRQQKIGRVAVKNYSHSKSICGVGVDLIHYKHDGSPKYTTIAKRLIACSLGASTVDLHARCEETFDVFSATHGDDHIILGRFADGSPGVRLPIGKYQLKITALATDMARVDEFYFLSFQGYDHIEFRRWEPGDTFHDDSGSPPAIPGEQSGSPPL